MTERTPPDPMPGESMPDDAIRVKGFRGLLQRRAEAMLRKPGRASGELAEPGECHVVLQLVGAKPVQVMAVIRQATGLDLVSVRKLLNDAPVVVVSGVSGASADRVVERLQKAGAKAVAGAAYQPL